jgi:hypothetical protein
MSTPGLNDFPAPAGFQNENFGRKVPLSSKYLIFKDIYIGILEPFRLPLSKVPGDVTAAFADACANMMFTRRFRVSSHRS